jgi:hypothetical protein
MSENDPTSPHEEQPRRPKGRRLLSNRRSGWIVAAALTCAVIGLSVGLATSPSATAQDLSSAKPSASGSAKPSASGSARPFASASASSSGSCSGSSGDGSNARSGPAPGGAAGTVSSVSTASFTITTSGKQTVTITEGAFTTYQKEKKSTSASAIKKDGSVLVLGWTSGSDITATQVILDPTGGTTSSSAAQFTCGGKTVTKQVGQIPAGFSQGSGTLISGSAANKAVEAALAAYPGVIVDRVAKLSNGEYNVHCIGDSWPHHVFVNQDFKAVGAE